MSTKRFSRLLAAMGLVVFSSTNFASAALADTGAPPNGTNLGFAWVGTPSTTVKGKAAFLLNDGVGLDLCGANNSSNCSFEFLYSVNGSIDTQVTQSNPFTWSTWPTIDGTNQNDKFCTGYGGNNGPYTNYNCFNTNGFGQLFNPSSSGPLTDFSMAMACLAPTGSTSLTAHLYEASAPVYGGGAGVADSAIVGSAIATASVTLSHCSTSWSAKAFSGSDFVHPTINFGSVNVDSAKYYVVLFTGDAIAGTQPTGTSSGGSSSSGGTVVASSATPEPSPSVSAAPTLAKTGAEKTIHAPLAIALLMAGYFSYTVGFKAKRKAAIVKWLGLDWLDFKIK